jgi:hypothetical protein
MAMMKNMKLVWHAFFKASGITDLNEVPVTWDPQHKHVKACLFMYSMESFLYKRINQVSRSKDSASILTLGPYAVALARIIDKA